MQQISGRPIFRAVCEGWDRRISTPTVPRGSGQTSHSTLRPIGLQTLFSFALTRETYFQYDSCPTVDRPWRCFVADSNRVEVWK